MELGVLLTKRGPARGQERGYEKAFLLWLGGPEEDGRCVRVSVCELYLVEI
jgi:hypothetical protein